jgi:hypothetical protein
MALEPVGAARPSERTPISGRTLDTSIGAPSGGVAAGLRLRQAQRRESASVFVPRKTRMQNDEWAGLLASGSVYRPHLPVSQRRKREFA